MEAGHLHAGCLRVSKLGGEAAVGQVTEVLLIEPRRALAEAWAASSVVAVRRGVLSEAWSWLPSLLVAVMVVTASRLTGS